MEHDGTMRGVSRYCHGPLRRRPDDGLMRVSALWVIGGATLLVASGVGWTAVAAPPPSSRIFGYPVLVTLAAGPRVVLPSNDPGTTTDDADADGPAGVGRPGGSTVDGGAAVIGSGATTTRSTIGGTPLVGQPWSSTSHGTVIVDGSAVPGTSASSTSVANPASTSRTTTTTTRPTSAPPTVTSTVTSTSPSSTTSAPRTVTVTRVRVLSDDPTDGKKDDTKEAKSSHDD